MVCRYLDVFEFFFDFFDVERDGVDVRRTNDRRVELSGRSCQLSDAEVQNVAVGPFVWRASRRFVQKWDVAILEKSQLR